MVVLGGRAVSYERGTIDQLSCDYRRTQSLTVDPYTRDKCPFTGKPNTRNPNPPRAGGQPRNPAGGKPYRGTSLIRNSTSSETYSSICLGPYGGPRGGGLFLMIEVPLQPLLLSKSPKPRAGGQPGDQAGGQVGGLKPAPRNPPPQLYT